MTRPVRPTPRRPRRHRPKPFLGGVALAFLFGGSLAPAASAAPVPDGPAIVQSASGGVSAPVPAPVSRRAVRSAPIVLTVQRVDPAVPALTHTPRRLTIRLTLTNTTGRPMRHVEIRAERGDPIAGQASLDTQLANPPPPGSGVPITPVKPVFLDVPAVGDVNVSFVTTTSITTDAGICLCHTAAVYPLKFSAHLSRDGADELLGTTTSYLPTFDVRPTVEHVTWVWPLIDRPHRLADDTIFTDDSLAASVGGGRLANALTVVEDVAPTVPLTLVVDPELIDELAVMATGHYSVQVSGGKPVPGSGQRAAADWLARLRSVLDSYPQVDVVFTPFADPDLASTSNVGLGVQTVLPDQMNARVTQALGGRNIASDVIWPASGRVTASTLAGLAASGVTAAILPGSVVTPAIARNGVPVAFANLRTRAGPVTGALTTAELDRLSATVVSLGGRGVSALPELLAELAVRTAQAPTTAHTIVLTPPRYVDPSPEAAASAILATSRSLFTRPVGFRTAVATVGRTSLPGRLHVLPRQTGNLSPVITSKAVAVTQLLPSLTALLVPTPAAQTLLAALPSAVQRIESAAWRSDSTVPGGGPHAGARLARELSDRVAALTAGVHIVRPSASGSYTLASANSRLPITVANDLDYAVRVNLEVASANGLPGFTAHGIANRAIEPHTRQTLQVAARVDRAGRIPVVATLESPDGQQLGQPVNLSVHSTVLGVVGVVITVTAGTVLLLALLVRALRRWRTRRESRRDTTRQAPLRPERVG